MTVKSKSVRLTNDIVPHEYFLTIHPDISTFTFKGDEEIVLELKKPTTKIKLHAAELEISSAIYNNKISGEVTFDKKSETATITFSEKLPQGVGSLVLNFTGILNDKMRGFYKSKYLIDGKEEYLAVSQFESTDARRAFPCFDEPAKKAVFHISLIVPSDHMAISNSAESEIKEHAAGFKIVKFDPTPKMSTYLLALIVGKFDYIEKRTKEGTLVRIFVTPGKKKQAEFALDVAVKTITFFSDYFKIPYPIPFIDLIAIPDFAAGAMENWGAVTYRETALLVDPEHSATINKQWVALVIAHEFAHQWFGNLVTMEWWTHLWLNEGFASYIEYLAVDHIFPEWDIWTQFVNMDHARALELDGLQNTHPIEVEVHDPTEISEIFDAVSYSKGASIIRMLAEYLGEDVFREGLHMYLKKHSYDNASTNDLWKALEKVSGKKVEMMMSNWTQKAGYPVLTIQQNKDNLVISQNRFFSSIHSQKKSLDTTVWDIPISISTKSHKNPRFLMMNKISLSLPNISSSEWIKLNIGETSLVRIAYPMTNLIKLLQAIEKNKLSTIDRFGVIRDILVLSEAGRISTIQALTAYSSYKNEKSYIVWSEIATQLSKLSNLLAEEKEFSQFEKFALSIFRKIGDEVGWDKKPNEEHSQSLLRSVILGSLGKYGDEKVIAKAKNMFEEMLNNKIQINSDLRGIVYTIVAKYGDEKTYSDLLRLYRSEPLQEEKDRLFKALCFFKQETLLKQSLEFGFSAEVRTQDSYKAIYLIFANPYGRHLAWDYLKKHWNEIAKRYSGGHLFTRFAEPLEFFTKKENAVEIEKFFKLNSAPGAERTIKQAVEKIYSNDEWLKRDHRVIKQFLETSHS